MAKTLPQSGCDMQVKYILSIGFDQINDKIQHCFEDEGKWNCFIIFFFQTEIGILFRQQIVSEQKIVRVNAFP